MGIDICQWRCRIGCFSQPVRVKSHIQTLKITSVSIAIRIVLFLLLVVYGIEANPGPGPDPVPGRGASAKGSGPPRGRGSGRGSDAGRGSSRYSLPAMDNRTTRKSRGVSYSQQGSPGRGFDGRGRGRDSQQRDLSGWVMGSRLTSNSQNSEASGIVTRSQSASGSVFRETSDNQYSASNEQNTGDHSESEIGLYDDIGEGEFEVSVNLKDILLEVRRDVKQINWKFDSMERSIKGLQESNTHLLQENMELRESVSGLTTRVENLETIIQSNCEHTEKIEAQSRRSNLNIYGIEEDHDESWETTEGKFREYVSRELNLNESNIQTERVHRLRSKGKPSPIIVKFSFFKDRDLVLRKYRDMRKAEREANAGKDENSASDTDSVPTVRIGEDFPFRVRNVRKKLIPFLKKSISEGKEAFLKYDKLCVDGDLYNYCEDTKSTVLIEK